MKDRHVVYHALLNYFINLIMVILVSWVIFSFPDILLLSDKQLNIIVPDQKYPEIFIWQNAVTRGIYNHTQVYVWSPKLIYLHVY